MSTETAEDPDETVEDNTNFLERSLLIGAVLDSQVQEHIKQDRKHGLDVNTSFVIAAAFGIVMSHDENQLAENGQL